MKVSLNWINEFVNLKGININEIVSRFSLTTAEVEGFEVKGEQIKGVVVGEIKTCSRHPSSQKPLFVLTVDQGDKIVPVVCGAPNCRVGLKVAFAKAGSELGDVKVGKAVLAGVESHGMCCSGRELGISTDHDGIIEFEGNPKNGTPIEDIFPIYDTILDIDNKSLTNRPDLWGHYGIARELSAIFGKQLLPMTGTSVGQYKSLPNLPKIPVEIENKKDCYSYGALRIDNITRRTSPLFMQIRLFYCGINSHGFLVDLTNYIMLECGQPSHAFDARRIGKISIGNIGIASPHTSRNDTTFVTLKDQAVKITPEMLFIKSDGLPVALAGVIGGKNSEIESDTKNCIFEFAIFDAASVRKAASAIGVRTDASNRYEKSLDVSLNRIACERTLELVQKYDTGAKVASTFNHIVAVPPKQINISVKKDYLERFCGMAMDYKNVERNLTALGFAPVVSESEIKVSVPSWRATKDIGCTADLIEEIVRTFGYDKIVPAAPRVRVLPVERKGHAKLAARIKDLLCDKYAFDEVHTYLWNDTKLYRQLNIETPSYLSVINSCVKDDDAIRSAMIPALVGTVARNRKLAAMNIFEVGKVCTGITTDGSAVESQVLGLCMASRTQSANELYKKISEILRDVMDLCGFRIKFNLGGMRQDNYLHPKNNAAVLVGDKIVGGIGIVHPTTAAAIDAKMNLAAAAIHLDWLDGLEVKRDLAVKISKYQKNTLDFTFVTDKVYGEVEEVFDTFRHPLFMGYHLKDVYGENLLSYTLTFTVGSFEKTLTAADIDEVHKAIIAHGKNANLNINI